MASVQSTLEKSHEPFAVGSDEVGQLLGPCSGHHSPEAGQGGKRCFSTRLHQRKGR